MRLTLGLGCGLGFGFGFGFGFWLELGLWLGLGSGFGSGLGIGLADWAWVQVKVVDFFLIVVGVAVEALSMQQTKQYNDCEGYDNYSDVFSLSIARGLPYSSGWALITAGRGPNSLQKQNGVGQTPCLLLWNRAAREGWVPLKFGIPEFRIPGIPVLKFNREN